MKKKIKIEMKWNVLDVINQISNKKIIIKVNQIYREFHSYCDFDVMEENMALSILF